MPKSSLWVFGVYTYYITDCELLNYRNWLICDQITQYSVQQYKIWLIFFTPQFLLHVKITRLGCLIWLSSQ